MKIYSRFSDKCIFKVILSISIISFVIALCLCQYFIYKLELHNSLSVSCLYSKDIECLSASLFNLISVKDNILYIVTILLALNGLTLGILLSIIINSIRKKNKEA